MPATALHTFTSDEIKLHWTEDYVTAGLNKQQTAESHGIVRGFTLAAQAPLSTGQFRLLVDEAKGDSVCCVPMGDGSDRVVTIVRSTDIDPVDISGLPNGTYWVCLFADYQLMTPTVAYIYCLTTAELTAPAFAGKYTVLGWVNKNGANIELHPAAGTPNLGVSDYSLVTGGSPDAVRQYARNLESLGRVDWQKMVRFGRADEYMDRYASVARLESWKQGLRSFIAAGEGFMEIDDTDPYRGDLHFTVNAKGDGGGAPIISLYHKALTHVRGGDIIRFSLAYKIPAPIAGGWSFGYGIMYLDKDGNMIAVPGPAANLLALDPAGAATAWTKIENEVHVIDGRNIEYAIPYLNIYHNDATGIPDVLYYFDDIEMEVLTGRGPELDPSVDANEHVMQPTKSSILTVSDWVWDAAIPTQAEIVSWVAKAAENQNSTPELGRSLLLERIAGPASPPWPLLEVPGGHGLKGGLGPAGVAQRHRQALFEQNTPRAWATLQQAAPLNMVFVDGYGISGVVNLGVAGHYQVTMDTDEDGNPWTQDLNYAVTFGLLINGPGPVPITMYAVVVDVKGLGFFDIVVRQDGGAGAWNPFDLPAGAEVFVQVFAAD